MEATTSLVFMLLEVPEPVWKTSIGNSSFHLPSATSRAASPIASPMSAEITPSSALTLAVAALIWPRAAMLAFSNPCPEIGKFSTALCVWARHLALAGTLTSPIESCSTRNSLIAPQLSWENLCHKACQMHRSTSALPRSVHVPLSRRRRGRRHLWSSPRLGARTRTTPNRQKPSTSTTGGSDNSERRALVLRRPSSD